MKLLSAEHLLTVAIIVTVVAALTLTARLVPGRWTILAGRILAVLLIANESSWWLWLALHGGFPIGYALPLQLCDVACFAAAGALWTRRVLLVELTYFWGLAGTLNGLLTPEVANHFPDYLFFQYFIAHGAIVGAALFLVVGIGIRPRAWAALRVFGYTLGLLAVDAVADVALQANYLYLRHTPGVHSLLDVFGPWPLYIIGAAGVTLLVFAILDLPFTVGRRLLRGTLVPGRLERMVTPAASDPERS